MQKSELFDIGDLSTLTTSSKKVAGAINELKTSVDGKFDKAGGTLTGNVTISGNTILNNTLTKTLAPSANNVYSLGLASYRWDSIYSVNGNFTGNITANSLISGANGLIAAKKMKTLDSNFMWLMNSTEGKWMTFDLIDEPKIYTYDSGKGTIGASDHRWGGVYSTNGDFSGSINLGGKGSIGADHNYAQLLIKAEPSNGIALEQNNKGMVFINGIFRPYTANNGAIDLGTPTQKFKDLYLSGDANITSLNATGNVSGASLKATANLNVGDNFIIGFAPDTKHMFIQNTQPNAVIEHTIQDGSGNTIGLTLQNEADNTLTLRPKAPTINCNLGQENNQWNNGYFKGGLNVGSLKATTIDADNIYSIEEVDALVSSNSITVEDVLTSTSTTNALSAAQGKALKDGKLDKTGGTLTGNITFGTNNSISVKKIKSLSDGIMWIMNSAEGNYVTFDLRSTPEMTIDSIAFKNKGTIKADPSYAQLLISAEANNGIAFEQGNSGLVFMNNTFRPYTANNGAVDLGASAQKFKDLYLSGNITADSVNGKRQWTGTKAQYDAIATKDANTLYFVLKE